MLDQKPKTKYTVPSTRLFGLPLKPTLQSYVLVYPCSRALWPPCSRVSSLAVLLRIPPMGRTQADVEVRIFSSNFLPTSDNPRSKAGFGAGISFPTLSRFSKYILLTSSKEDADSKPFNRNRIPRAKFTSQRLRRLGPARNQETIPTEQNFRHGQQGSHAQRF